MKLSKMKVSTLLGIVVIIFGMILTSPLSWAVESLEDGKTIVPEKTPGPITIDGELAEDVWKTPPLKKVFKTFHPNYGDIFPQDTEIWTAYDGTNLYFAFKCYDAEPDKIKTSIAQRDNIGKDDYVAIFLDALGTKQSSYEFYINPNGIQMDLVNSVVSGSDMAPDFVWESSGKLVPEGYQVEVRIPLESIRYKSGKKVKMGVIFARRVSRLGISGTWPEIKPGQTDFNVMVPIIYQNLKTGLKLEILPNVTYSRNSDRVEKDKWEHDTDTNIGMAIKYGITSSITAEATVNPDFSQVESDAYRVEVNQRYPIFYSEKRPFFMESQDVLDFSIVGGGMMSAPVHTRQIIDPEWALKLSGSTGKMNFAFLAANDRAPGRDIDKNAVFGVVRAKYNIGSDNTLGILYSGRHFNGEENNVGGIDLTYRLSKDIRANVSYLYAATREAEGAPLKNGNGINAMLEYKTRTFWGMATYERYDTDFYMATAFQKRTGFGRFAVSCGPVFNLKIKKLPWLKRASAFINFSKLHDLSTGMDDTFRSAGVHLAFAPMGEIILEYGHQDEAWAGELLDAKYLSGSGFIQLSKWLHVYSGFSVGERIYYDPTDPFVGNGKTVDVGATVQPSVKLNIGFDYSYADLKEKIGNLKVYSVNIYNLHTTYQFNKYFFLRGILRYNSFQEKLLTDFLASFTLIPGTVVHLGYGSLSFKNQWQGNQWVQGLGDLTPMKRGLFFKASYLFRF